MELLVKKNINILANLEKKLALLSERLVSLGTIKGSSYTPQHNNTVMYGGSQGSSELSSQDDERW